MLKNSKKLLLILILFFTQSNFCLNIIFDLGGVLIKHNTNYFANKIPLQDFFIYLTKLNNPLLLKKRLFELLANIPAKTNNTFCAGDGDENGKKLPNIMSDWLSGKRTSTELRELALQFIIDNPEFCHTGEKEILIPLINLMFTPKDFAKSSLISQEGLKFVKMCKDSGHQLFILSNWDLESSFIIIQQLSELFDLFDINNIVFSGRIGLIKPDPKIYEYILEKYNLNPEKCIFFDDQSINLDAAKLFGIHTVLCKNTKCTEMVKELNKFTKLIAQK